MAILVNTNRRPGGFGFGGGDGFGSGFGDFGADFNTGIGEGFAGRVYFKTLKNGTPTGFNTPFNPLGCEPYEIIPFNQNSVITFTEEQTADYIAIHELNGADAILEFSEDGTNYFEIARVMPGKVNIDIITEIKAPFFRVRFTGIGSYAVLYVGKSTAIPPQQVGFRPPELNKQYKTTTNLSEDGIFIGRQVVRQSATMEIKAECIGEGYFYNTWAELQEHVIEKPVFISWRFGSNAFAWLDGKLGAVSYVTPKGLSGSIKFRAILND